MGLRDMGIPSESIKQIETACEKLYLESRSLAVSYEQQDILLDKMIEELVCNAAIRISNNENILEGNNSSLNKYQEKMIIEIKKLIEKNRNKLDNEVGYFKLKKIQDNAELLLQYEKASNVLLEREPSLNFVIDCLKI